MHGMAAAILATWNGDASLLVLLLGLTVKANPPPDLHRGAEFQPATADDGYKVKV